MKRSVRSERLLPLSKKGIDHCTVTHPDIGPPWMGTGGWQVRPTVVPVLDAEREMRQRRGRLGWDHPTKGSLRGVVLHLDLQVKPRGRMVPEGLHKALPRAWVRIWGALVDDGQADGAPQVEDEEGLDVANKPIEALPGPPFLRHAVLLSGCPKGGVVAIAVVDVRREV